MKKRSPVYENDSVTYWPVYVAATGCIFVFSIVSVAGLLFALWIFSKWEDNIFIIPLLVMWLVCIGLAYKLNGLRDRKIIVNRSGIEIFYSGTKKMEILWVDVREIRYERYPHYGLESFVVVYETSNCMHNTSGHKCNLLRLPLGVVDRHKIESIFPATIPIVW